MKSYKVIATSVVEGRPVREGEILSNLTDDEAKPYVANKAIEEIKTDDASETIDQAPSELHSESHQTKRVAAVEKAADKKAAKAEEE